MNTKDYKFIFMMFDKTKEKEIKEYLKGFQYRQEKNLENIVKNSIILFCVKYNDLDNYIAKFYDCNLNIPSNLLVEVKSEKFNPKDNKGNFIYYDSFYYPKIFNREKSNSNCKNICQNCNICSTPSYESIESFFNYGEIEIDSMIPTYEKSEHKKYCCEKSMIYKRLLCSLDLKFID